MPFFTRVLQTVEGIGIALEALVANKVRAALTIFGVAIGVFVVVAAGTALRDRAGGRSAGARPPEPTSALGTSGLSD